MSMKKYLLLAGVTAMSCGAAMAQDAQAQAAPAAGGAQWSSRDMTYKGKNYDVLDSSYYSKKQIKQFRQYIDHQSAFPPKPRNQYEVGLNLGLYNLNGDIPSLMLWQKGGGSVGVHVRKSFGYVFSLRANYTYGVAKNLDVAATQSYGAPYINAGYIPNYNATATSPANNVYRAIRMESSQFNMDFMFNFNNISFHRARNNMSFYGFFGLGGLAYKTRVNALNAQEQKYDFNSIVSNPNGSNSDIRSKLQSGMDKTYESNAESGNKRKVLGGMSLAFAPSIGAGVQFKINKQFNISVEDRYTFTGDDYLDGTRFGKAVGNIPTTSQGSDGVNNFTVGINYNVRTKKKSVEPLYWINPLDHSYNELSYPRHMLLPAPILPDEDNDGVTDQYDKCPKTPTDVKDVDAHGCPIDTDGDGVPDYKDKQKITPTECQPVDADGVGHCPCPEGCGGVGSTKNPECKHVNDGFVTFKNNAVITSDIQAALATLAAQMRQDPNCKVVVVGGGGDKKKEQRSWERVNAVIEYMTEKQNILRERFIFQYGKGDDENVVNFRGAAADETGPSVTPPPHPNLK